MRINRLHLVLISITLYWYLIPALNVESGSITKITFTFLLWLTALVLITNYINNYHKLRSMFDFYGLGLLNLLLLTNGVNIFRGFFDSGVPLTTSLGNPFNALALIAPLAIAFASNKSVPNLVNRYLLLILVVGSALVMVSFAMNGFGVTREYISPGWSLIYPMVFLIGAITYLSRVERYAIIGTSILYFWYIGLIIGSRATVLRICFLYFFAWLTRVPYSLITHFIYPFLFFSLFVFSYQAINTPLSNGESIFQQIHTYLQDFSGQSFNNTIIEKADTRTFLYYEVINDLINTGNLIFGKGSSGTYYSEYFQQTGQDVNTKTRLTVEAGILAYLLKGGVFAVLLNISLFLYASYLAICKSNSRYVKWLGFTLIVHVYLLFVESLVSLDLYNLCIWLITGICLAKEFLAMKDYQIKALLNGKR